MPDFTLTVLYVNDALASAALYAKLLGHSPTQSSPNFVVLPLGASTSLGLWSRHMVQPAVEAASGGGELAFMAKNPDAIHADWAARGLQIAQAPTDMGFGRTFVALDPDGHRLRVFKPAAG